jgi:hypothetical protein
MNLAQVEFLLGAIKQTRGIDDFVVMGSISVLGMMLGRDIPEGMILSNDLDAYPRLDPGRAGELTNAWGQGSAFEREHGYYFDAVSPNLPTLPAGWQDRLIALQLQGGVKASFLEPNDAAISKYARGDERDRRWIREGLRASILSLATLEYRCRETDFLDQPEHDRVKVAIREDREWVGRGFGS